MLWAINFEAQATRPSPFRVPDFTHYKIQRDLNQKLTVSWAPCGNHEVNFHLSDQENLGNAIHPPEILQASLIPKVTSLFSVTNDRVLYLRGGANMFLRKLIQLYFREHLGEAILAEGIPQRMAPELGIALGQSVGVCYVPSSGFWFLDILWFHNFQKGTSSSSPAQVFQIKTVSSFIESKHLIFSFPFSSTHPNITVLSFPLSLVFSQHVQSTIPSF